VLGGLDFKGSVDFDLLLYFLDFLALFVALPHFLPFAGFCGFSLFYMTFLSFFDFSGLLAVLHGILDLNFKLCTFCCHWTHQGGD
jgi:hypothetical protein